MNSKSRPVSRGKKREKATGTGLQGPPTSPKKGGTKEDRPKETTGGFLCKFKRKGTGGDLYIR